MKTMNRIHIYAADADKLNNDALYDKIYTAVSRERRDKVDKLLFRKDKNQSLAAEYLLMYAAGQFGITDFKIKCGENGKPYFENEGVYFNLSHSGERVMCAIGTAEVGCDVERIKDINLDIARRCFYKSEYDAIMAEQGKEAKQNMFFRLWTLKESFIKVLGLGMKLPLDKFRVDVIGDRAQVCHNINQNKYFFREYDFDDGYKYAVCSSVDCFAAAEKIEISVDKLCNK